MVPEGLTAQRAPSSAISLHAFRPACIGLDWRSWAGVGGTVWVDTGGIPIALNHCDILGAFVNSVEDYVMREWCPKCGAEAGVDCVAPLRRKYASRVDRQHEVRAEAGLAKVRKTAEDSIMSVPEIEMPVHESSTPRSAEPAGT